jgi:hypothetical protein
MPNLSGNNKYTNIYGQLYYRGVPPQSPVFLPLVMQNFQMVKQIANFDRNINKINKLK